MNSSCKKVFFAKYEIGGLLLQGEGAKVMNNLEVWREGDCSLYTM